MITVLLAMPKRSALKANTYACLVSPLYQYPRRVSQIYEQAIERNVTLLSYIHLKFLLDYTDGQELDSIWRIGNDLPTSKNAQQYWEAIDETACDIAGESEETLSGYKQKAIDKTKKLGKEGIDYWETRIAEYRKLSQRDAVARLIKVEKVENKIRTIKKAIDIVQP